MDNVASIVSAPIKDDPGLNPESLLVDVQVSLANSIPLGGYGVQRIYNAAGKLVEVRPFFDAKVPKGEKSAAVEKIAANRGIANVVTFDRTFFENFDSLSPLSESGVGPVQVGIFTGTLRGSISKTLAVTAAQSFSSPHSAGMSFSGFPGTAGIDLIVTDPGFMSGIPLTKLRSEFRFKIPAAPFGDATGPVVAFHVLGLFSDLPALWQARKDAVVPPTSLAFYNPGSLASGSMPALPLDSQWHHLVIEFLSKDSNARTATFAVTLDGVRTEPTFTLREPDLVAPRALGFAAVVDASFGGSGAVAFYLDDFRAGLTFA